MRMRAAVLEEFGEAAGRARGGAGRSGAGRGARAAGGVRGVPHRHVHRLGRGPVGLRADGARPRGRRRGGALRRGRERCSREGDHVVTLFSPQCGECVHCVSPLTNLCLAIREQQNLGYLPDGTTRLSLDGEPLRHFMGTSTFARVHRDAGDRAREDRPRGAARPRVPVRVRALDGPRRGDQDGRGARGLDVRGLRRGHGRPGRGRGRAPAGRRADRVRRPVAGAPGARARPGRDGRDARGRERGRARSSR